MIPWFWLWAPQWHLPLSGDVAQRIEPDTNWFFGAIPPAAGNARIEQRAFEHASYGRHLGLLSEVVLGLAAENELRDPEARKSLERLRKLAAEIESLKDAFYSDLAQTLASQVNELRRKRPEEYARMQQLLAAPPAADTTAN